MCRQWLVSCRRVHLPEYNASLWQGLVTETTPRVGELISGKLFSAGNLFQQLLNFLPSEATTTFWFGQKTKSMLLQQNKHALPSRPQTIFEIQSVQRACFRKLRVAKIQKKTKQEQVMHWFANEVFAGQVHRSKICFNICIIENSRVLTKNARSNAFLRGGAPLYNNVTNETISYQNKKHPSSHKYLCNPPWSLPP